MAGFALFFATGVWLLQQQAVLPDLRWAGLLIIIFAIHRVSRLLKWHQFLRTLLIFILALSSGFFYAAWMAQQRLADTLPSDWQGKNITIVGVVAEMPRQHERGLGFNFDVEQVLDADAHVPQRILLSTYQNSDDTTLSRRLLSPLPYTYPTARIFRSSAHASKSKL